MSSVLRLVSKIQKTSIDIIPAVKFDDAKAKPLLIFIIVFLKFEIVT